MSPLDLLHEFHSLSICELAVASEFVSIAADATAPTAACPVCGTASDRVHSRYIRTVADLPWQGRRVVLRLTVRRFRCLTSNCPRAIFGEPLPRVAAPHAHATHRLAGTHRAIGLALGGEAGSRLAERLAIPTSPDTILRRATAAMPTASPTPRVLGVDDFAFRRGRTYGTILVDLERRRVVDLLPDRTADTLAAWLRSHPGVEVVSRDRASAYTAASTAAAPHVAQVADRFHLLVNVREAVDQVLARHMGVERTEAVLHGLGEAFAFFGCVPRELWWDNPTTVAVHVLRGRERTSHPRYAARASHYPFAPKFCLPATATEKTRVENRVYDLQRQWATPVPPVNDLAELNDHLRRCCVTARGRTRGGHTATVGERFGHDRAAALPVPGRAFDACIVRPALVDKYQTARFDGNRYSVPRRWAFRAVTAKGYVDRVAVVAVGQVVAVHPRSYGHREQVLDPLHFLTVLGKKPAAPGPRPGVPARGSSQPVRAISAVLGRQNVLSTERRIARGFAAVLYFALTPGRKNREPVEGDHDPVWPPGRSETLLTETAVLWHAVLWWFLFSPSPEGFHMRLLRWAAAPTTRQAPAPVDPPSLKPNCVRCRGEQFAWEWRQFGDAKGLLVFCSTCGAALSWDLRVESWSI